MEIIIMTTRKTSFTRSKEEKNFIGHIVFPYDENVKYLFFGNKAKRSFYGMYWNGEEVHKGSYDRDFMEFLTEIGYEFKLLDQVGSSNSPKTKFENIPILPTVEYQNGDRKLSPIDIVVAYHAKDIIEVGSRGKQILNKVFDATGVSGRGDIYGKMERC
jgi:hypothetical protein